MTVSYFNWAWKCHALDTHQNLHWIIENDIHMATAVSMLNINYKLNISNTSDRGRRGGHEGKTQESEALGYFQTYQHAKSLIISKWLITLCGLVNFLLP